MPLHKLRLIIVSGTTTGILPEHTGSTKLMTSFIKKKGERYAALAMHIRIIAGLPIFCDSTSFLKK